MSIQEESLASPEGVDVSTVAVVHFDNSLRLLAANFFKDCLSLKRRCIIPISPFLEVYHILTRYVRIRRAIVSKVHRESPAVRSLALYPDISTDIAVDSLECTATHDIESWDGYLVVLAISLNAQTICTLDVKLGEAGETTVVNSSPAESQQVSQMARSNAESPEIESFYGPRVRERLYCVNGFVYAGGWS